MPSCVLRYCKNTSKNVCKASGITFHRFLRPGHSKREEWIKFVQNNRSEETWLPSEYTCICSAHFKAVDFCLTKTGRRFLRNSAIPWDYRSVQTDENQQTSPAYLIDVEVSDSESIFDTPQKIKLKEDLRKTTEAKQFLTKKIKKLQRQNRHLKQKNERLTAAVKQIKDKFGVNRGTEIELVKRAEIVEFIRAITDGL